jgi:hypothetical protein
MMSGDGFEARDSLSIITHSLLAAVVTIAADNYPVANAV